MISFSTVSCTWAVDLSHVAPNRSLSAQVTTSIAMVTAYYNNMLSWCPLMCCMVWATCEHVHKGRQWPLTSAESGLPSKVEQLSVSVLDTWSHIFIMTTKRWLGMRLTRILYHLWCDVVEAHAKVLNRAGTLLSNHIGVWHKVVECWKWLLWLHTTIITRAI